MSGGMRERLRRWMRVAAAISRATRVSLRLFHAAWIELRR